MKRTVTWQMAFLAVVLAWSSGLRGEDAPLQREDINRALEMYRWLIDHEEFNAAAKLAAEMKAMHPDDPQVQLIVENAQLRAAVREASRVMIEDRSSPIGLTMSGVEPAPFPEPHAASPMAAGPFEPAIDWRRLGNIQGSGPVDAAESEIIQASGVAPQTPEHLLNLDIDWTDISELTPDESEEDRLRRILSHAVSLHFEGAPLSDVMRHLSETCGINVVIDEAGLQEAGVTSETAITINVDGIQAKSALNLILKPLDLDYVIEDEVLQVTSHSRQMGEFHTRVYAVSDLVTPIPHRTPASVPERFSEVTEPPTEAFEWLIDLIVSTIHPDSWSLFGGQGHVVAHEDTLSLVIRQQDVVHEEICGLLEQVRSQRDVQVTHELRVFSMSVANLAEVGLSEGQGTRVLRSDEQPPDELFFKGSHGLPGLTLFNRQTGSVIDGEHALLISSHASPDRGMVRLNVAAPDSFDVGDVMSAVRCADVPDGEMVLVLLSDTGPLMNEQGFVDVLAITPRIQVREEEEELLRAAP